MFAASTGTLFPATTTGSILSTLLDGSLRGLAILAVALLISRIVRQRSAAVQHLIWLLALVGLILVPLLSAALPTWEILPGFGQLSRSMVQAPQEPDASYMESRPAAAASDLSAGKNPVSKLPSNASKSSIDRDSQESRKASAGTAARAPWTMASLQTTVVLIWAGVAASFVAFFWLGWLSLWRLGRTAQWVTAGPLADLLDQTARQAGVRRSVVMMVSNHRSVPMTWGIRRPKLLLPSDVDACSTAQTRMVLLHELAHIKRWDCATQMLAQFIRALYWFHPLTWIAMRRIEAFRERACDDLVLSWDRAPADYAEQLVRVSTHTRIGLLRTGSAVAMARQSTLERRVRAILSATQNRCALTRRNLIVGIFLLLCATIPAAMLRTSSGAEEAAQKDDDEADQKEQGIPDRITIAGVCRDENKKPIADARVRLFFVSCKGVDTHYPIEGAVPVVQRQLQEVRTDKQGRFRFAPADGKELREKDALLNVIAQAKGKATAWDWPRYFGATKDVPCELKLGVPKTLRGRVTNQSGNPVAGVVVGADAIFRGPLREDVPGICSAVTDADGRYEIVDLHALGENERRYHFSSSEGSDPDPSHDYSLGFPTLATEREISGSAVHPAYVRERVDIPLELGTADVTLRRPAAVAGQIVLAESGKPAAKVRLKFECNPSLGIGLAEAGPYDWPETEITTDAEGRYRLENIWPDRYEFTARLEDRAPTVGFVELKPGTNRFDLRMDRGGVIKGRIVDVTTKQPVAPAAGETMPVDASRNVNGDLIYRISQTEVGPDGTFTLRVSPGKTYLSVGFGDNWRGVNTQQLGDEGEGVYVADGQTLDLEVQLRPKNKDDDESPPAKPPAAAQQTPPAEQAAIAAITKLGGWVKIEPVDGKPHVVELNMENHQAEDGRMLQNQQMTDESLASAPKFTNLRMLALRGGQITDNGLANLHGMQSLEEVYLIDATELTDAGAAQLASLPNLKVLLLENSKITDDTLRQLSRLPKLTTLYLSDNQLTDKGLEYLRGMTNLEELCVGWSRSAGEHSTNKQITDAGLRHLAGLTKLKELELQNTAMTDAGLVHLRGLKRLETLYVSDAVTEAGLDNLRLTIPKFKTNVIFDDR